MRFLKLIPDIVIFKNYPLRLENQAINIIKLKYFYKLEIDKI